MFFASAGRGIVSGSPGGMVGSIPVAAVTWGSGPSIWPDIKLAQSGILWVMTDSTQDAPRNTLYYGDNLAVLREHVADESVDLIYLDPPFNSNADYNVLFAERDHKESAAQIKAFEDTWKWDTSAAAAFHKALQSGHGRVPATMAGFKSILGELELTVM